MFCYQWDLFGETAAAWVQAIGTLTALWLAIRAPVWHAEKAERDATIEQIQLFLALATEITSRCNLIFEKLGRNAAVGRLDIPSFNLQQMVEFANKCKSVDFTTLRDYRMLHFINRFPDQVESCVNDLRVVVRCKNSEGPELLKSKVGVAEFNYEHVTRTVDELKTLLSEYESTTRPWRRLWKHAQTK